jgi:uncharacterized membrane protein
MGQSFIPFPTALMGEYHDNPLAVSFFGGVFAVNTLLFLALHAYIVRNLLKPELAALQDPHGMRKAMIGPASYVVGAAAAWFSIPAAFRAGHQCRDRQDARPYRTTAVARPRR